MYCTCIGLSRAASDVKEAIDRFNSGLKGVGPMKRKAAARAEAASLLLRKKSKQQPLPRPQWTHKFVCLAQSNKYFIPSLDYDKDKLFMADLGEKVIGFTKLDMWCVIRQLSQATGRWWICYVLREKNSNELEKLSKVVYVSPLMLKERCGPNQTYIVPL